MKHRNNNEKSITEASQINATLRLLLALWCKKLLKIGDMNKDCRNFILLGLILLIQIGNLRSQDSLKIKYVDLHFVMRNQHDSLVFITRESCTGKLNKNEFNNSFLRAYLRTEEKTYITDSINFTVVGSSEGFEVQMEKGDSLYNRFKNDYKTPSSKIHMFFTITSIEFNNIKYQKFKLKNESYMLIFKGNVYYDNREKIEEIKNELIKEGNEKNEIFISGPGAYYNIMN